MKTDSTHSSVLIVIEPDVLRDPTMLAVHDLTGLWYKVLGHVQDVEKKSPNSLLNQKEIDQ